METAPNSCKKLTKRRIFARRPTGRLGQSTLDGGTPPAGPFYKTEQAACRGLRRRVKPFCNLCDSRWADSNAARRPNAHLAGDALSLLALDSRPTLRTVSRSTGARSHGHRPVAAPTKATDGVKRKSRMKTS